MKNKHIVFVLGNYFPESDANVVCTNNLIRQLKNSGYRITCICATRKASCVEKIDGVEVYRIHKYFKQEETNKTRLRVVVERLKYQLYNLSTIPFFPNGAPITSIRAYNILKRINTNNKIDCVIATYYPFWTLSAVARFKESNSSCLCIGYYLDALTEVTRCFRFQISKIPFLFKHICMKRDRNMMRVFDKILMSEGHKEYYSSAFFKEVFSKMDFVGIPSLIIDESSRIEQPMSNYSSVYAGFTDAVFRNPEFAINVLKRVYKNRLGVFNLYGPSNIEGQLIQLSKTSEGRFYYHGVVPKSIADEAVKNAGFLISIGNTIKGFVPSKIFELFATGKPIIHFSFINNDAAIPYMEIYPNCCIIDMRKMTEEEALNRIDLFMGRSFMLVSSNKVKKLYSTATPEYTAKLIEKYVCE